MLTVARYGHTSCINADPIRHLLAKLFDGRNFINLGIREGTAITGKPTNPKGDGQF